MANKSAGGEACVEVPKAECVVPRGREGELAVRGDDDVGDKVVMATEDTFWVPVCILVAGELPYDNSLVYEKLSEKVFEEKKYYLERQSR